MGFATIENIIYIFFEDASSVIQVGLIRGLISIPAHIMFAINMGYYISKYKFTKNKIKKREYLIMSILIPIIYHGIFDLLLILNFKLSKVIFAIYFIFLLKVSLDKLDEYTSNSKRRFIKLNKK